MKTKEKCTDTAVTVGMRLVQWYIHTHTQINTRKICTMEQKFSFIHISFTFITQRKWIPIETAKKKIKVDSMSWTTTKTEYCVCVCASFCHLFDINVHTLLYSLFIILSLVESRTTSQQHTTLSLDSTRHTQWQKANVCLFHFFFRKNALENNKNNNK